MNANICLILTFLLYISSFVSAEKNKLLFVQILYRHGDRSPIELYPTDPNPASSWPEGLGKLTILGRKQHYVLGKYFRSMYEDFITSSPLEINVTSSGVDRCLKSAATNLASFYAPKGEWLFEKNFKWQPIPIYYIPKESDKYLETNSYCPRAFQEKIRVVNSPEGRRFITEHKKMYEYLSYYSGQEIQNWTTAGYLYDCLFIEHKYNLTIPSWAEPYWDELANVSALSFYWNFNSPVLHRLRAGPLLGKIIENMKKKISGELDNLKFNVYSAHDTNIAVVLDALDLFDMKAPPYASALLFELYETEKGEHVMRLLYQNSTAVEKEIDTPSMLILKGCTEFCPLEYFINYTQDLIPEDWEKECELDKSFVEKIKEQQITIGWFFILIAVVIVSMSIYTLWRIYSRRQDKSDIAAIKYSSLGST